MIFQHCLRDRSIRHPDLSDVKKKTFVSHLFADFYFIQTVLDAELPLILKSKYKTRTALTGYCNVTPHVCNNGKFPHRHNPSAQQDCFVFERPQVVFYCNFSCSRHVSKSVNLIGRIVFDAARQTKKTNPRCLKKNDAFTRGFFRVGVHTHIGTLCLVMRR